ncbi:MAG: SDR family NAD(P)-dependent oxidoreductase [Promethearchaeota archaeon]|jgi:NAD(P)-dependent dehydrogenase (short-subunit alcohol dehydrogenase family)
MVNRLRGKIAIVVGAGQQPGDGIGNGRAMSILFAREGAKVMLVDKNLDRAKETKSIIDKEGGESFVFEADITKEEECQKIADKCIKVYGKIDILVNNVGIATGDRKLVDLSEDVWDKIFDVNLKGMFFVCKYVLTVMEKQNSGSIINISSVAAVAAVRYVAYKISKSGVNSLTHQLAMKYAKNGIRVNAIMPGLIHTPMAIEGISKARGMSKEELINLRNSMVPLKGGMGSAWDIANAALFLASDEAKFITSVILPVDGGQSSKIG